VWKCDTKAQEHWTYVPDAAPDSAGNLVAHGKCATIVKVGQRRKIELQTCTTAANQKWSLQLGPIGLENPATGQCLYDPKDSSHNGAWVEALSCEYGLEGMDFTVPAGPLRSALGGTCMTDPANSQTPHVKMTAERCDGAGDQLFRVFSNWYITQHNKLCLNSYGNPYGKPGIAPGRPIELIKCGQAESFWLPLPNGEIINYATDLCLDNPGTPGARLVSAQCYGTPGEIWAEG
jgi:hypothetical protein